MTAVVVTTRDPTVAKDMLDKWWARRRAHQRAHGAEASKLRNPLEGGPEGELEVTSAEET